MKIKLSMKQKQNLEAIMFISPWIIGTLVFFMNPLIQSIRLSFSKIVKLNGFVMQWNGWANYEKAFLWDVNFLPMFLSSVKDTLINTPLTLIFSLFIAILVNKPSKMRGFFRTVFFLPVLLGTGFVMKQLLGLGMGVDAMSVAKGIIVPDSLAKYFGFGLLGVISSFLSRITIVLWKSGVQIVLFLAGLQGISSSLYEAAHCDGATEWEMFWKITLPMISPVILLNFIYTIIDSFTDANNPIVDYILKASFQKNQFEYGAAMGWVYFIFVFVLCMLAFFVMRNRVYTGTGK